MQEHYFNTLDTQTEISYSYAQPLTATPVAYAAPAEAARADQIAPPTNPPLAEPLGTPVVVAHADPVAPLLASHLQNHLRLPPKYREISVQANDVGRVA